jgi:hypothetical protein
MEPFSTVTNSDKSRQKILGLTVLLDEAVGNITDALKVRPCCSCRYYATLLVLLLLLLQLPLRPLLRHLLPRLCVLCACASCVVPCALCHLVVDRLLLVLQE